MVTARSAGHDQPPAILLGGSANALSVARSLSRHRVPVVALNKSTSHVRYSRHCRWVPLSDDHDVQTVWLDWLTGDGLKAFRGAVVLPCNDDGLELIARHRGLLKNDYVLIEANDEVLLAMLDKAQTYALAEKIGAPMPMSCSVRNREELLAILDAITYPCALKPRHSHMFQKHFPGIKLFVARDRHEMMRCYQQVSPHKLEMLVTEIIPGGEDQYCSYYSYIDEQGRPCFNFTKRKLRQYPNGFGLGTYHVTDWNPEVAEAGLRFFQGVGLRGLGNVEFKRDARDGQLKLIECNPRFTMVNELLRLSGLDVSLFVYNRLIGRPLPPMNEYRRGVHVIRPFKDFLAFRASCRQGELSWGEWLRSLLHPQHLLYFRWTDPWPTIRHTIRLWRDQITTRLMPLARRKWLGSSVVTRIIGYL